MCAEMADMDTVEGAASGRRPGQQKQGVSHRGNGRISSKENLCKREGRRSTSLRKAKRKMKHGGTRRLSGQSR